MVGIFLMLFNAYPGIYATVVFLLEVSYNQNLEGSYAKFEGRREQVSRSSSFFKSLNLVCAF